MKQFIILTLVLTLSGFAQAEWGTLKGQFLYGKEGTKVPKASKLTPTKDVQVCGKQDLFNEDLLVNEKNRGIANVVLWAYKPTKVHPDYEKDAKTIVELANKSCRFEPHVLTLRAGQTLRVTNPDPVAHNALMAFIKNRKNENPMIPVNGQVDVTGFKASELVPMKVSCSIHNWMLGYVLVQDHPYMAVTDKDGKFELKNLPAGKLKVKVYHEKCGYVKTASIDGKSASWKRGLYNLSLASGKEEEHKYTIDPKIFAK